MFRARDMLEHHKAAGRMDRESLVRCIEACYECAQTCAMCADACLAEDEVKRLARCIRLDLDCMDICVATGNALSRQVGVEPAIQRAQVEACMEACRVCADECDKHAKMHEHCRICSEMCDTCKNACKVLLGNLEAKAA
ncbi:hypothetical protein PCS_02249 [Desulfocurvibacter africanus PCS]|uniref:Four-helix bundle copper-binding protein n=1 Tax=Desulfocurvibacter africanus PCS TaxID=1262666 RepID=M5PSD8_DESAF|nr:four-helix bundle copper-binding protein [Desulfocurvibacter africanus]EMG36970.1 hypothetical protein PCS_02249 [Desulfocurvibacter africanus PCS]